MGSITNGADSIEESDVSMRLQIDLKKPVPIEFNPLYNWSLSEIRDVYGPYRKRRGSPVFSRSEFCSFLSLSRMACLHLYDKLIEKRRITITQKQQMYLRLQACSYYAHTQTSARRFIVDFYYCSFVQCVRLDQQEISQLWRAISPGQIGRQRILYLDRQKFFELDQDIPQNGQLEKYTKNLFARTDLNNDQTLQLSQALAWLESQDDPTDLFRRFDVKGVLREEHRIFLPFCPYPSSVLPDLFSRIQKAYSKIKLNPHLSSTLKLAPIHQIQVNSSENHQISIYQFHSRTSICRSTQNEHSIVPRIHNISQFPNQKLNEPFRSNPSSKSRDCRGLGLKENWHQRKRKSSSEIRMLKNIRSQISGIGSVGMRAEITKKRGQLRKNIIILKGRTITKKQIFDLRDYFDRISEGSPEISLEEFVEAFSSQKYNYMKSVASSLFNFLDSKGKGKIGFLDLVSKLYPHLQKKHLKLISIWDQAYTNTFTLERSPSHPHEIARPRVLPKACAIRLREIFNLFDSGRKGFITLQDMLAVFSDAFSENEICQLFTANDTDHDGKLSLKEFARVLLPPDLEIQEL